MRLVQDASVPEMALKEIEGVSGAYAQYTFNIGSQLLVMGGLRYDYSSLFGSMVTPRFHFRWNPGEWLTLHGSAGRGLRTPHIMAENNFLLASGRRIIIDPEVRQEDAANYGIGAGTTIYIANKPLTASAEYYYTHFAHQLIADLDSDPHAVTFRDIDGRSFSHTLQIELNYPLFKDFNLLAAYRLTNVKTDYGQGLTDKPLTSRNKGLISASYAPNMGLWHRHHLLVQRFGTNAHTLHNRVWPAIMEPPLPSLRSAQCSDNPQFPTLVHLLRRREPDSLQAETPHSRGRKPMGHRFRRNNGICPAAWSNYLRRIPLYFYKISITKNSSTS